MFGHVATDGTGYFEHILQVGTAIFVGRSTYGTEEDFDLVQAFCQIGCEMETAGLLVAVNHLFKAGFVDRDDTLFQVCDLFGIYVNAENFGSHFCKTSTGDKPHITCPDDSYFHDFIIK